MTICLLVFSVYEYLRQHDFQWRKIRFDVLSGIGTAGGVILLGAYGYVKLHDPLAFSHAEEGYDWYHYFSFPWTGFQQSINNIAQKEVSLPGNSRRSLNINDIVVPVAAAYPLPGGGDGYNVSIDVQVFNGGGTVVVERPLYFNYLGMDQGGSDVIGYYGG